MPMVTEEEMMETTPGGRAEAAMVEVEPTITAEVDAVDAAVQGMTPTGDYSAARLNAASKVINKMFEMVGIDTVSIDPSYGDVKGGPLPDAIVRAFAGIKDALTAFFAAFPEEAMEVYEVSSIVTDADLAMATAVLDQLMKNKAFQRFLREEEPTVSIVADEEVTETVEEPSGEEVEEVQSEEVDILNML
tara:strand:+ start:5285 stop:5854 length:570 start_codon:yes stop_codon:yes gene_type:complete